MTKVFYASRYGATKQYAQWISQELSCENCDAKKAKPADLQQCETIIFGAGFYAGSINGVGLIKKSLPSLKGKNIIIFTVGLSEESDPAVQANIDRAFTKEEQSHIKFFHLRGAVNLQSLGFMHRAMMKMMIKGLSQKPEGEQSENDKKLMSLTDAPVDFTDKQSIAPISEYVKAL